MELPQVPPPKKSPLIDSPTSPQLIMGEQIIHFSHPHHPLSQVDLPNCFTCASCKEYGAGKRYTCSQCDFQLHDFCALAPSALKSHPLHFQHKLLFFSKPVKGGLLKSRCDICAKPIRGSAFICTACNFQMHPCCSMLSTELDVPAHPHILKILPVVQYSSNGDLDFQCGECKRRRSGRVYRCTVCDYHLHAVCAKSMINGLQANGFKGVEKPGMLGTAARVASKVVMEFIGGLIEGLGEGVGQVLIQSVTTTAGKHHITP
ncbi:hypothetical protein SLEP1_g11256 [Rubroshorea leprosula]|uniref:DC1 domain-containing protein n=1 Tax=Rubroshorea leprosula TaxID=152421 RepID=A0AAV5IIP2_9ROSI|nr:hypothetical protein SLEP1_g11256 [Rubroshorea leprosula]